MIKFWGFVVLIVSFINSSWIMDVKADNTLISYAKLKALVAPEKPAPTETEDEEDTDEDENEEEEDEVGEVITSNTENKPVTPKIETPLESNPTIVPKQSAQTSEIQPSPSPAATTPMNQTTTNTPEKDKGTPPSSPPLATQEEAPKQTLSPQTEIALEGLKTPEVQPPLSNSTPVLTPPPTEPSTPNALLEEKPISAVPPSVGPVNPSKPTDTSNEISPPPPPSTQIVHTPPQALKEVETIHLSPHESRIISLMEEAKQIFVADPKIADIQLASPSTLYVFGTGLGETQILATGKNSNILYQYQVSVQSNYDDLLDLIKKTTKETIVIRKIPNGIVLDGIVSSAKVAEDIRQLAEQYMNGKVSGEKGTVAKNIVSGGGSSGKPAVINQLKIKEKVQINLRVKVAEVQRTVINQVGINWGALIAVGTHGRIGILSGRAPIDPTVTTNTSNIFNRSTNILTNSIGARFKDTMNDIAGILDMLAQEELAVILAEPNLITTSGEEASFLVGGEFPYPLLSGVGAAATVTYQFKAYGISLTFTPTIIGDKIVLRIRPEVSELDTTNSIKDQVGNLIPSIRTRRAESTVEVGNGQSLAMAGLLSNQTASTISAFPGLGEIPILGALFRSNDFKSDRTELVIVVTPYIVKPLDSAEDVALPTEGLQFANLSDMVWNRRMTRPNPPSKEFPVSPPGTEPGECGRPQPGVPPHPIAGDSGFYF